MASPISFSGLSSGIDGAGIAKTLFDQLTSSNVVRASQIENLAAEYTSLEKLKTMLIDLADSVDGYRSVYNGGIARSAKSSNEDVLTAAAGSEANVGSFTVNVTSLARAASGSFDRSFSSQSEFITSDPSQTGEVEFTVGTGEEAFTFSVSVDELTTASDFVEEFNANADGRASASLVNLGTEEAPEYRISFSTAESGVSKGSIAISSSNEDLLNSALQSATLEQASNAKFTVSGLSGTVERESNTINDVIPGVSLQLHSTGAAAVTVSEDFSSGSSLEGLISAFNSLVKYVNTEDAVSTNVEDGEPVNSFGSLAKTDVDDSVLRDLRSVFANARSEDGRTLASFGVSTNRDGTLAFDKEAFETAVRENPEAFKEIQTQIADALGNTGGTLSQYTRYAGTIDSAIKSNESEIESINQTIAQVERNASAQEEAVLKQFTNLESLLARLNADSQVLSSLLNF